MTIASTLVLAFLAAPMSQLPQQPERRPRTVPWQLNALLAATLLVVIAAALIPSK